MLEQAHGGDRQAAADLLPLVYEELRRLAAGHLAGERVGHSLNATALVHEAYLKLVGDRQFGGRGHFFAAAAEAMRRILVDQARARLSLKRGGAAVRADVDVAALAEPERADELLAVHEVLDRLAASDPTTAELVKLRYFVGMTMDEAALVLGLSTRKAERLWTYGRAWLRDALRQSESGT